MSLPEWNSFINADCMDYMNEFPDNYFDLAIVDPPYGIGVMSMNYTKSGAIRTHGYAAAKRRDYRKQGEWDIKPSKEYFEELRRVSKKQIIWGGNYFSDMLPPSKGFICWDKRCNDSMTNDFADCEYAWISEGMGVARVFRYVWNGMIQGNMKDKEQRFHPTQKPIALYKWILTNYAKEGDTIIDTHCGSASSLIAYYETNHKYIGFEIDKEYYQQAKQRLDDATAQMNMFDLLGENLYQE